MQTLPYIIVLALAFPVGYLLAYMARDEIKAGKKWFIALAIVSALMIVPLFILTIYKFPIILTLLFIIIISLIAVWKSYDKKWVKEK